MIPRAHVTAWRNRAPWPDDDLVEQDLVLSRALVEVFQDVSLGAELGFRGGTALHKMVLDRPSRYSEDIDLVQLQEGPIRSIMQAIHARLDPWLGSPSTRQGPSGVKLIYAFESESEPRSRRKLKVEIHTREHFTVHGVERRELEVKNPWFTGTAGVPIYRAEELLGTKLRALYQRKKGRDLFDLALSLDQLELSHDRVVECFRRYTRSAPVTRAQFEANLAAKMQDSAFTEDLRPLLPAGVSFDLNAAYLRVSESLIAHLPGARWKGGDVDRE